MHCLKVSAVLSFSALAGVVHAGPSTHYTGEIRNFTDENIYLTNQSWDLGGRDPRDLKIPPGEGGGFNIQIPSKSGDVNIIMSSDGGRSCNFVLTYGTGKKIRGPMTLIGPSHWKVTKSFGRVPATCEMKVDDWVYNKSFHVRYRMK